MTDTNVRFVILDSDNIVIRDKVEGVNFRLDSAIKALDLCAQLEGMHHAIGVLLEELDRLKFPLSYSKKLPKQMNLDFDSQEAFGELESTKKELNNG